MVKIGSEYSSGGDHHLSRKPTRGQPARNPWVARIDASFDGNSTPPASPSTHTTSESPCTSRDGRSVRGAARHDTRGGRLAPALHYALAASSLLKENPTVDEVVHMRRRGLPPIGRKRTFRLYHHNPPLVKLVVAAGRLGETRPA